MTIREAERRFTSGPVQVRAAPDAARVIGGYAAKFDRESQDLGGFVERIDRRFFNKSRGDGWPGVMARYNHDDNQLLGTTAAGSLTLKIDRTGLRYDVEINAEDPVAVGVAARVKRGDVARSSFAFIAFEDDWTTTNQGFPLRTLITGRLLDVAPVNSPAYEDTSVGLRSLAARFDATIEEVRALAERRELGKFFKRTDTAGRRSPRAALAAALALDAAPPLGTRRSAQDALAVASALNPHPTLRGAS